LNEERRLDWPKQKASPNLVKNELFFKKGQSKK